MSIKYQEMDKGVCGVLRKVIMMVTTEFKLEKEVVEDRKSQAHHLISFFKAQSFSPLKRVLTQSNSQIQPDCVSGSHS